MGNLDRLKGSFEAMVSAATSRVDYFAFYPCAVVSQNADGTLELRPENARLPGFSKVPIRHTVPGMRVTIGAGDVSTCRALVGFDGGDPRKPFVAHFFGDKVTEVKIGDTTGSYEFVALADKVLTELNKIKTAFDAHTHAIAAVPTTCPAGVGTATGTTATSAPIPAISSVASVKVKTH